MPPTLTMIADSLHRAYLAFRAESASDDLAQHILACNPCFRAVHMPGPGQLCPTGDDLADRYEEVTDRD